MAMHTARAHFSVFLIVLLAVYATNSAGADSPSVTAVLSNSETGVGATVQLQIRVTGDRNAESPDQIMVDGLEIYRTGKSQHFEMNNFSVTASVIYSYTIMPLEAGTFKIPPQTIRVADKSVRTPELTLHVADSPGAAPRSNQNANRGAQPATASKLAFAELIVPKKTAFVGEAVPAEIRLGFDPRARPALIDGPEITGQGFTAQKLKQSGERLETIDGKTYSVVSFKTAIAAARAGKFEIGPVRARAQVSVPRQSSTSGRGRRSPYDLFNLDDPFSDPFFADPFGQMSERREVEVKSEPVSFEVKPLPPNAPPNFSGAIGNFTMTTDAKPTSLQVGDPITVTSTITGRGNFDRVNAPVLENEHGWHKYPPSSKFKQDDDVGISGAKSFETVISPNEKKQAVPPFAFAYFDPAKESYATLRSDSIPINVEGSAAPAPDVAAALPASTSAPPGSPNPVRAAQTPADILYQLTELPKVAQSFTPLFARPIFWAAQLVLLIALLGFAGWKIRQNRIDNREAQRIAALQHEATDLMRKLRRKDASPQEYYAEASRMVRLKAALARNVDPNNVDFETAATAFQLDQDSRERLRRLFERSDELQYSGTRNGAEIISPESRHEVLELIENLRT